LAFQDSKEQTCFPNNKKKKKNGAAAARINIRMGKMKIRILLLGVSIKMILRRKLRGFLNQPSGK
jgi:hypothetical protein